MDPVTENKPMKSNRSAPFFILPLFILLNLPVHPVLAQNTDEMVRAMRDLLVDRELRERMERLGLNNAAHFSWERTAQKTLEVYYGVEAENRKQSATATSSQHVSKP